jgi:hypothetical protein
MVPLPALRSLVVFAPASLLVQPPRLLLVVVDCLLWTVISYQAWYRLQPHLCACMQLMVPADSAHDTVDALGGTGLLQFRDLNHERPASQRSFANQVRFGKT